jgi:hypothetical protein
MIVDTDNNTMEEIRNLVKDLPAAVQLAIKTIVDLMSY